MKTRSVVSRCIVILGVSLPSLAGIGGCGSEEDGDGGASTSSGVGSACSEDSDCKGYDKPSCLSELRALDTFVFPDASDTAADTLRNFTLQFPGGYCMNTVEDSCASDSNCGPGGGCYRPFEGLSQEQIDALNDVGLPLDVTAFADVGLCLKPCASNSDCRNGYRCQVPICAVMFLFNESYDKKFCVAPETGGELVNATDPSCPVPDAGA